MAASKACFRSGTHRCVGIAKLRPGVSLKGPVTEPAKVIKEGIATANRTAIRPTASAIKPVIGKLWRTCHLPTDW
jgi:hypothetical protein